MTLLCCFWFQRKKNLGEGALQPYQKGLSWAPMNKEQYYVLPVQRPHNSQVCGQLQEGATVTWAQAPNQLGVPWATVWPFCSPHWAVWAIAVQEKEVHAPLTRSPNRRNGTGPFTHPGADPVVISKCVIQLLNLTTMTPANKVPVWSTTAAVIVRQGEEPAGCNNYSNPSSEMESKL